MTHDEELHLTPAEVMNRDRKQRAETALAENEAYRRGMAEGMRKFNSTLLNPENDPYKTKENRGSNHGRLRNADRNSAPARHCRDWKEVFLKSPISSSGTNWRSMFRRLRQGFRNGQKATLSTIRGPQILQRRRPGTSRYSTGGAEHGTGKVEQGCP